MALPKFAVRRPVTIWMLFSGVIVIGIVSLLRLPVEMMPNMSFGQITVLVEIRGGMPPQEVETLVTKPIEEAVGGVSHLRSMLSTSKEELSTVILSFEPGTDMDFAALEVREKFALVKNKLPQQAERPVIAQYQYADVPIMILAIIGKEHTPEELRRIVDETIKPRINRVEGVANVEVSGGRERKILVELNQARLAALGLPIGQVISTLNTANINLLAGDYKLERDKYLFRVIGEYKSLEEIGDTPIGLSPERSIVRLRDAALVKDSFLEATTASRLNTRPVVSLYIQKESTANTVSVAQAIKEELKGIEPLLGKDIKIVVTSNHADYIKAAINTVKTSLLQGAFWACLVLYLFFRDWHPTSIIALSIPISVVATFIFMNIQKLTLNVISLSGLALGIGMLVDNSIVVLENIFHRRERLLRKEGTIDTVISATEEMVLAIAASTLTTVVVFLPIVFVNKEIQLMYSGIAWTVTYSLLASLFVAVMLVPMLASRMPIDGNLIRKRQGKRAPTPPKPEKALFKQAFLERLKAGYSRRLEWGIKCRYKVILVVSLAFLIALFGFMRLDKELVGATEQNKFTIFIELPTGAKLEASDEAVRKVEAILAEIPEVKNYSARVEKWSSKVYVELVSIVERRRTTAQVIDSIRPYTEKIHPAFIYFEEAQEVGTKEVVIDIFGYDYEVLRELAYAMAARMEKLPNLTDVKIRHREGRPELGVRVDKKGAASYGLTVEDISDAIHTEMRGLVATRYHTEGKEVEVIGRLREEDRKTFDDVRRLVVAAPESDMGDGRPIRLQQVSKFEFGLGPSEIWRKNKNRMIQVSGNVGKMSLGKAVDKIRIALSDVKFPEDYFYRFGGDYERLVENQKQLKFAIWLTFILVYLVLASLFESFFQPLIIMATLPLAIVGVVLSLYVTSKSVSLGVLIGIIMLFGIVVNNAIILIDHINRLRESKGSKLDLIPILMSASTDRLRPIMMTTLTTILGLFPMAIDRSEAANLWSPLAITVIGGLLTSTMLTLFVIPCVYMTFEDTGGVLQRWYQTVSNGIKRYHFPNKRVPILTKNGIKWYQTVS